MKRKNLLFVFIIISILIVAFSAIYFVTGVSSVYEPIKRYQFNGTVSQLVQKTNLYCSSNRNIVFNTEDTVGNQDNGYAFHYTVVINFNGSSTEYDLKLEETSEQKQIKTIISVVGAHDYSKKLGGYKFEDKGVTDLISNFEYNFINKLNKDQNTSISSIIKN